MNAVVVHRDVIAPTPEAPDQRSLDAWVRESLSAAGCGDGELTVRIVDEAEIAALNGVYRGTARPTNVLSFTAESPVPADPRYLGDIVISAPVVAREAGEQGKSVQAHWAHLVVHGVLHLVGFDHVADDAAERMESLEREILAQFGYADPYA